MTIINSKLLKSDGIRVEVSDKIINTYVNTKMYINAPYATAGEPLYANDIVAIRFNGYNYEVMKANAAAGLPAIGYLTHDVTVYQPVGVIIRTGIYTSPTSIVPDTVYYLSTIAGKLSSSPPTNPGEIVQKLGFAISGYELMLSLTEVIIL